MMPLPAHWADPIIRDMMKQPAGHEGWEWIIQARLDMLKIKLEAAIDREAERASHYLDIQSNVRIMRLMNEPGTPIISLPQYHEITKTYDNALKAMANKAIRDAGGHV